MAGGLEMMRQLAQGGGFTGAINTGDHDHEGAARWRGYLQGRFQRLQQGSQAVDQRVLNRLGRLQIVAAGLLAELFQQADSGVDTDIGRQQQRFKLFEQFVIDLAAREQAAHRTANLLAGFGESGEESLAPGAAGRCLGVCVGVSHGARVSLAIF